MSTILAVIGFALTKAVLSMWTTPYDQWYDAMSSGEAARIKAAIELRDASENGDMRAALAR